MSALYYDQLPCALGTLTLIASDAGLRRIEHDAAQAPADAAQNSAKLKPYGDAISAYLQGKTQMLNIALDLAGGTDLQRNVWEQLAKIPFGSTISYTELAKRSHKPSAVRAVASACGKNPLPLVIPCHRVVAKDGGLGGFAWGLSAKQALLALEQAA